MYKLYSFLIVCCDYENYFVNAKANLNINPR